MATLGTQIKYIATLILYVGILYIKKLIKSMLFYLLFVEIIGIVVSKEIMQKCVIIPNVLDRYL